MIDVNPTEVKFCLQAVLQQLFNTSRPEPVESQGYYTLAKTAMRAQDVPGDVHVWAQAKAIIEPVLNEALGFKNGAVFSIYPGSGDMLFAEINFQANLPQGYDIETLSRKLWDNKDRIIAKLDLPDISHRKQ